MKRKVSTPTWLQEFHMLYGTNNVAIIPSEANSNMLIFKLTFCCSIQWNFITEFNQIKTAAD